MIATARTAGNATLVPGPAAGLRPGTGRCSPEPGWLLTSVSSTSTAYTLLQPDAGRQRGGVAGADDLPQDGPEPPAHGGPEREHPGRAPSRLHRCAGSPADRSGRCGRHRPRSAGRTTHPPAATAAGRPSRHRPQVATSPTCRPAPTSASATPRRASTTTASARPAPVGRADRPALRAATPAASRARARRGRPARRRWKAAPARTRAAACPRSRYRRRRSPASPRSPSRPGWARFPPAAR